jgi:hypothetical protein
MLDDIHDRLHTLLAAAVVGSIFLMAYTIVYLRGAWIDAMEEKRRNIRGN